MQQKILSGDTNSKGHGVYAEEEGLLLLIFYITFLPKDLFVFHLLFVTSD